jgi:beta-galactosidase
MKTKLFYSLFFIAISLINIEAQVNKRDSLFDSDWKFFLGKLAGAEESNFEDKTWRIVNLPHDWSIEDLKKENVIFLF